MWCSEIKMIRWSVAVVCAAVVALSWCQGQPVGCTADGQCSDGYFCQLDVHDCRPCVKCESLHRQPPPSKPDCVHFVADCGPCEHGYVLDRVIGDGCVKPTEAGTGTGAGAKAGAGSSWYKWLYGTLIAVSVISFVVGVVVYACKNTETSKVFSRTSVEAPVGNGVSVLPSAPLSPPYPPYSYSAPYDSAPSPPPPHPPLARPDTPPFSPTYTAGDPSQPLVKRVPGAGGAGGAGADAGGAGGGAREAAGSQRARVFSNPHYVRNVPHAPPSYESAIGDDSDHEGPSIHDENTMESDWTPVPAPAPAHAPPAAPAPVVAPATANDTSAAIGAGDVAGAVALPPRRAPRVDTPSPPPPNKLRRVEDSNNNRRGGAPSPPPAPPTAPAPAPPAAPHAPGALVINVLNYNTVNQLNDLTR